HGRRAEAQAAAQRQAQQPVGDAPPEGRRPRVVRVEVDRAAVAGQFGEGGDVRVCDLAAARLPLLTDPEVVKGQRACAGWHGLGPPGKLWERCAGRAAAGTPPPAQSLTDGGRPAAGATPGPRGRAGPGTRGPGPRARGPGQCRTGWPFVRSP